MYRIHILILLVTNLFAAINGFAQSNIEWQKTIGGSSIDIAHDVELTTDGGYVVAGVSRSIDGDITQNIGWTDYWVVKLTNDSIIEWERNYGGTHHDVARDIFQTSDGGYIVAGYSSSEDGHISNHHGLDDFWVIKLASDGTMEWEKSLGGYNNDFAYTISQTNDGGYIVGGASNSDSGDVTGNHGNYDYWVVKLSNDGSIEWQKSLGGSKSDFAYSLEQTTDGGYIVAGKSHSNDGDVTGNHDVGNFVHDFWVVKLTSLGVIEWQKSLGGSDHEVANSVRQTIDEGYIVAGITRSIDGDVTENFGGWDYWVVKLDNAGVMEWQKTYGTNYDESAHSIIQTSDGGYMVVGCSGDVIQNFGSKDYWVVKLDNLGEISWQDLFGGSNNDRAYSVQQTSDNSYIIAGQTQSNNKDVTDHHGEEDYWVIKIGPCGVDTELKIENQSLQSLEGGISTTFQWINCSDGSIITGEESSTFSPSVGGDYAVILTNGNCIDTSACLYICPLNTDITTSDHNLQSTENSPTATYQWIDCNNGMPIAGAVNQIFEPTLNGEYAVIVTDGSCSVTSECITACPESINTEVITLANSFEAQADILSSTFQWMECNSATLITGEISQTFTPTTTGEYAVIVTQGNCVDTSGCFTFCFENTNIAIVENTLQSTADTLSSIFQWIDCNSETLIVGAVGQTFTPTTNGEYAVIVTQGSCVDTSACLTFCYGNTNISMVENTLQTSADSLGSTFQWINCNTQSPINGAVGQTFSPTVSGAYAVIVTQGNCIDTSGCLTLCIENTDILAIENTLQSSADSLTSTFQWFDCDTEALIFGAESQNFTPTESGTYAVIISQGSCLYTSDCANIVIVDLEESTINHSIKLFPNPVKDFIRVETENKMLGANYRIYDASGKQWSTGRIEKTDAIIKLERLPNGVYMINFELDNESLTMQFVKGE